MTEITELVNVLQVAPVWGLLAIVIYASLKISPMIKDYLEQRLKLDREREERIAKEEKERQITEGKRMQLQEATNQALRENAAAFNKFAESTGHSAEQLNRIEDSIETIETEMNYLSKDLKDHKELADRYIHKELYQNRF